MNKQQFKTQNDTFFRLSGFYIAAFLLSKGFELVNIEHIDQKRSQFVFLDSTEREVLLNSFSFAKENSPEVLVDARKFVIAIKTLKEKLYQERI